MYRLRLDDDLPDLALGARSDVTKGCGNDCGRWGYYRDAGAFEKNLLLLGHALKHRTPIRDCIFARASDENFVQMIGRLILAC